MCYSLRYRSNTVNLTHSEADFSSEGAISQQLSRDEIREFFFREGLIRLDETLCKAFDPSVEITPARWDEFAGRAGINPGLDPMTVLENLHLLKNDGMTHAGAWCWPTTSPGSPFRPV